MTGTSGVLRLATRGSPLALWQARRVVELLAEAGVAAEPVVVSTEGDRRTDVPLAEIGGQGVFVTEVRAAVARGDAEAAVHSAKDVPAADPPSGEGSGPERPGSPALVLAAFPERGDPRDVLVGARLDELAAGATVATGSARRRVQLAHLRPDLSFTDLRGNLATRLSRVGRDGITAVVVARAALDRLGWEPPAGVAIETLGTDTMLPQVSQGALAVECREDDEVVRAALAAIDDGRVRDVVEAERAFLAELGGGCTLPVGAHAVHDPDGDGRSILRVTGLLGATDGSVVLRHHADGADGPALGRAVARHLLDEAVGSGIALWESGPAWRESEA